ncbi:MAG: restriction endonuclease, partial [Bacteroidota bacterium]
YQNTCNAKFLYYLNLSPVIEQQFKTGAKATTQSAFGITKVRLLRVPLCSKEEQHQIVREIESRLSVCDKVEQNITEGLEKAEALRQSILKKAFEGKLLSEAEIEQCRQEADYEPASVLLEKIKSEQDFKRIKR